MVFFSDGLQSVSLPDSMMCLGEGGDGFCFVPCWVGCYRSPAVCRVRLGCSVIVRLRVLLYSEKKDGLRGGKNSLNWVCN